MPTKKWSLSSAAAALLLAALLLAPIEARATTITLLPANSSVSLGDPLDIDILADIDAPDAIIGFGFDLALSGTGGLSFGGFTPNAPTFDDDPIFLATVSDADGIRGASAGDLFLGPPVSGTGILLGTLAFTASAAGAVTVDLGADDLNIFFSEGLIPLDPSSLNFLPPVALARVTVNAPIAMPQPGTLALFGLGLAGLALLGRRRARGQAS